MIDGGVAPLVDSVLECAFELLATDAEGKVGIDEQINAYRFVGVFHLGEAALTGVKKLGGLHLGQVLRFALFAEAVAKGSLDLNVGELLIAELQEVLCIAHGEADNATIFL